MATLRHVFAQLCADNDLQALHYWRAVSSQGSFEGCVTPRSQEAWPF
jgi:hypothetical protein